VNLKSAPHGSRVEKVVTIKGSERLDNVVDGDE
jgi:hypothetical protein